MAYESTFRGENGAITIRDSFYNEMEKIAKVFYRGMGEPWVKDVMRVGLPAGTYITTSKKVAKHYADTAAYNILTGTHMADLPSQYNPKVRAITQKLRKVLPREEKAAYYIPTVFPAKGAVIRMQVSPKDVQRKAIGRLREYVVTRQISPDRMKVVSEGIRTTMKPGLPTMLSPKQYRIIISKLKKNPRSFSRIERILHDWYRSNIRGGTPRSGRKLATKLLKTIV